jgi:enoyl-CoA hydratase/carnithine racemase
MTDDSRRSDVDGVITVTFTRESKRNAVTTAMFEVLQAAVRDLGDDDAQRVLIITGEGQYFTSGIDYANLRSDIGEGADGLFRGSNFRRQYRSEAYHDLFDEMEAIEKPVILAAQGHCIGVGVEMAASCDFRFATPEATFALPEVANIATIPGSGGISRLTRMIGPTWAKWMAMACQPVSAEQAKQIGFIQEVYPAETFSEQVMTFARKLAAAPREAMGLAKIIVDAANSVDRRTAREIDRIAQTTLIMSEDHKSRVSAFLAGRAARNNAGH